MSLGLSIYDNIRLPVRRVCQGYYLRWWYNGWHYWFFYAGRFAVTTEGEKYRTIGTRKITIGSGQVTPGQCQALRTIMNTREVYLLTTEGWMNIRIEPGTFIVFDNQTAGYDIEITAIIGSKEISATGYSPVIIVPVVPPSATLCETIIGTQVWECKNYDADYPGSKVYNDDEANRVLYGGLYTFSMINTEGFCPVGWHVATLQDWATLIIYLGGIPQILTDDAGVEIYGDDGLSIIIDGITPPLVGNLLKEMGTSRWNVNSTGNDLNDFTAVGGGYYSEGFNKLKERGEFWTPNRGITDRAYGMRLSGWGDVTDDELSIQSETSSETVKKLWQSVRMIKDTLLTDIIYDIDGNLYHWVTIGTQQWLQENLKTTKYADGTPIPNLTLNADWIAEDGTPGHDGAYCYYNNNIANKADYGALYDWYAVDNVHGLAPTGWNIPSDADFNTLITNIGGAALGGGKLKEEGTGHWLTPNTGATNDYNFSALGSGVRYYTGLWDHITTRNWIWSSVQSDAANAYHIYLLYNNVTISGPTVTAGKRYGMSVRCMRDIP